jgi:hypothetical protein
LPYQLGLWKIHKKQSHVWFHGVHYLLKLSPIPKGFLLKKKNLIRVSTIHHSKVSARIKWGEGKSIPWKVWARTKGGVKPTSKTHYTSPPTHSFPTSSVPTWVKLLCKLCLFLFS